MQPKDYPKVWPRHLPTSLTTPRTSVWYNLEVSAKRYPDKAATIFYDSRLTYAELARDAERLAGFLRRHCGIRRGDRVLLAAQNSPQFIVAYYAILRCDAVVVPVGPMNVTAGDRTLRHRQRRDDGDCGSGFRTSGTSPLIGRTLAHVLVATYADYLTVPTTLAVPEILTAPRDDVGRPR